MSATAEAARAKLSARELAALRAELRRELAAEPKAKRAPRVCEPPELAAAARRMVRALSAKAGGDVDALPLLAELARDVDRALFDAVTVARSGERLAGDARWSWADVGRVLGITRQSAQERFSRPRP